MIQTPDDSAYESRRRTEAQGALLAAESEEPAGGSHPVAAAPLRWLVLFTFSLVSAQQQIAWVLPGALQPNFVQVFAVSEQTVQLLTNYGCFFFILFAIPAAWALDRLGCRLPVLACAARGGAS